MENQNVTQILKESLRREYPFGIPRIEIKKATGGILDPLYMANLDCKGIGIPGKFYIGRKAIYPVDAVVEYLESIYTANYES